LHTEGTAEFRFLGKDSVLWHKQIALPEQVLHNLEELIRTARPSNSNGQAQGNSGSHPTRDRPQLFPNTSSRDVNAYLSEILPGLTAKVFRTHHATVAVQRSLQASAVEAEDPEHKKWEAANLANLEAAVLCNHTKKEPASWPRSQKRYKERKGKAEERVAKYLARLNEQQAALAEREQELALQRKAVAELDEAKQKKALARYERRLGVAQRRVERVETQLEKARQALGKVEAQASVAAKKRTWNLGTSLKSYIDPRVYHEWGQKVDYDVLERYYPKALRQKFAWVKDDAYELPGE
jgi:DNA topoisomerase-1